MSWCHILEARKKANRVIFLMILLNQETRKIGSERCGRVSKDNMPVECEEKLNNKY
jgi:hypothetical protein